MKISEEFTNCFTEEAWQNFTPFSNSFYRKLDLFEFDKGLQNLFNEELLLYFRSYLHFNKKDVLDVVDVEYLLSKLGSPAQLVSEISVTIRGKKISRGIDIIPQQTFDPSKPPSLNHKIIIWAKKHIIIASLFISIFSLILSYILLTIDPLYYIVPMSILALLIYLFASRNDSFSERLKKQLNEYEGWGTMLSLTPFGYLWYYESYQLSVLTLFACTIGLFFSAWHSILRNHRSPNLFTFLLIKRKFESRYVMWKDHSFFGYIILMVAYLLIFSISITFFQDFFHPNFLFLGFLIPISLFLVGQYYFFSPILVDYHYFYKY